MNDNNPRSPDNAESTAIRVRPNWMRIGISASLPQRGVDANQLTSISAMIAYIASKTGISEFRIERDLADRFHVPNAKCLARGDFDEAIRYLADMLAA